MMAALAAYAMQKGLREVYIPHAENFQRTFLREALLIAFGDDEKMMDLIDTIETEEDLDSYLKYEV